MRRRLMIPVLALLVAAALAPLAKAQPASDAPGAPAGIDTACVLPYVDEYTAAIVRFEPSRVNVDEVHAFLKRVLPADVPIDPVAVGAGAGALAQWKAAEAKEGYLVVSVLRFQSTPLLVIPLPEGDSERDLRVLLNLSPWNTIKRSGGVLLCGDEKTVEAALEMKPSARNDLDAALKSLGPATISAALALTDDQRRVVRETLPPVPEEFGGSEAKKQIDELKWLGASIDAPPNATLRVALKTSSPENAEKTAALITSMLRRLAKQKQLQAELPNAPALAEVFLPQPQGDVVGWKLAEKDEAFQKLLTELKGPLDGARVAAKRSMAQNQLKQIGLACHNFHDTYNCFPPAASLDKNKKPLLSWRVHILPYIEQQALYQQFKLDEPWDSPHNIQLSKTIVPLYRHPASKLPADSGKTNYLAVVGSDSVIGNDPDSKTGPGGVRIRGITDGTSNTIMVLEVPDEEAVIWTKPDDWEMNAEQPLHGLGGPFAKGFNTLFADGSVRFIVQSIDPKTFFSLLTRSGGEVIDSSKF